MLNLISRANYWIKSRLRTITNTWWKLFTRQKHRKQPTWMPQCRETKSLIIIFSPYFDMTFQVFLKHNIVTQHYRRQQTITTRSDVNVDNDDGAWHLYRAKRMRSPDLKLTDACLASHLFGVLVRSATARNDVSHHFRSRIVRYMWTHCTNRNLRNRQE